MDSGVRGGYLVVYTLFTTEFGHGRVRTYEAFTPDFSPPQTHIVFILVFTHIDTIDYGLYNAQQTSDMLALSLNTVSRPVLTASAFTGSRVQTNTPMAAARGPQRLEVVGT